MVQDRAMVTMAD